MKDRAGYVQLKAESFVFLKIYDYADVHIFDDGSKDFTICNFKTGLLELPFSSEPAESHPDEGWTHFEHFLQLQAYHDFTRQRRVLHPSWRLFLNSDKALGAGALSLYNSATHKPYYCDEEICLKKTTGSFGMVLARATVSNLFKFVEVRESKGFDWAIIYRLDKLGISFMVPKNSRVLHYGMHGNHTNKDGKHSEVALDFDLGPFPTKIQAKAAAFLDGEKP